MADGCDERLTGAERDRIIIRTSIIGILANLLLAGFKAAVGILSNSIAVTLDAVNNMTDALSSVVTIIGTKLAGKKPDKKHPLGYGRIEYLTTMVIAAIILYAGITSMTESVDKIINPQVADYSTVSMIIIGSAIFVKLILGTYVKRVGKKVNSSSLIASGTDALFDAILSTSVFLSAVIFLVWNISLEAYVGALISVFIIKSGLEMLRDTLDEILGKRADKELTDSIKETMCQVDGVQGAYDLILHNYGPNRVIGSVHIEVPSSLTAEEIDVLGRKVSEAVYSKHGVIIAAVGIYSVNEDDDLFREMRSVITRIVMSHEGVIQMHGFHVDRDEKRINLDIIIDYSIEDRESIFSEIRKEISDTYPDYELVLILDADV